MHCIEHLNGNWKLDGDCLDKWGVQVFRLIWMDMAACAFIRVRLEGREGQGGTDWTDARKMQAYFFCGDTPSLHVFSFLIYIYIYLTRFVEDIEKLG